MSHPLIPAPVSSESGGGPFVLRPGTIVAHPASVSSVIVERFCVEMARRTGLRLEARAGMPEPHGPAVRIEVAAQHELEALPAPQGLSPTGGAAPDERYRLVVHPEAVLLRAAQPVGVARGLTSLVQLVAAAPIEGATIAVPGGEILDGPRYSWRGLSLDLARAWFGLDELHRVIDLVALYKLNVLHLHLTDDESWRLPFGRSAKSRLADTHFYRADELRTLCAYAADRFVTIVPEVDTPGHTSALVQMHPELRTGRNEAELELPHGQKQETVWLDPELPATFELIERVLAEVAALFPGPFIHIGGDEPRGMPHDLYESYVRRVRDYVRSIGKRPVGWQESARAGLGRDDVIQYWRSDANPALSQTDIDVAAAASAPVIVSPMNHCYLDVPYAERAADPEQSQRQSRVGMRRYSPMTVAASFEWEPAEALGGGRPAQVAGVEAAIWCETVSDLDDLMFLLLPRLAGVAHRAWSEPNVASWTDHREALARHDRLWRQDGLTFFRV